MFDIYYMAKNDSYSDYPKAASKNAKKAIDWKEKYGRDEVTAGTEVGWQRAHQLAKGEALSRDVVSRMAQFNRHRKNSSIAPEHKDEPWKDNGYVAWLIWGGDEGVDWAMKKMDQIKKEEDAMDESIQANEAATQHMSKTARLQKKMTDIADKTNSIKDKIKSIDFKMKSDKHAEKNKDVQAVSKIEIEKNKLKLQILNLDKKATTVKMKSSNESWMPTFESFVQTYYNNVDETY